MMTHMCVDTTTHEARTFGYLAFSLANDDRPRHQVAHFNGVEVPAAKRAGLIMAGMNGLVAQSGPRASNFADDAEGKGGRFRVLHQEYEQT